jgi:ATP-dependent protease Clp ATPase subunit
MAEWLGSYCGILREEGSKFIAGPSEAKVYICRACVETCVEVLEGGGVKFKWSAKDGT